jgi:hypothetical protein
MTTTVLAPAASVSLSAPAPYVVQSCVVSLPPPPAPAEGVITLPAPPTVEYENLPVIDPDQYIDTSPDRILGCANSLPEGGEQAVLRGLFPDAIGGDGIINRGTGDIWKYDGTDWENVGPNPGLILQDPVVLPPWNETEIYDATVRTRLQIQSLDYALALLTEPDPIGVVLGLDARRVRIVATPALTFTLAAQTPRVSVSARVDAPTGEISAQTHTPVVQRAFPGAQIEVNGLAPIVETNLTSVRVPSLALQLTSHTPALVALPAIGEPFEGGYFVGLISHTEDGVATHALVVAPECPKQLILLPPTLPKRQ